MNTTTPSANKRPIPPTSIGIIIFVMVLTSFYLIFELAFNARLLDVVGSGASQEDVHNIEISGRLLSGVAAALVVLQVLLTKRKSIVLIVLACALTIGLVYVGIQSLVNYFVDNSSPEFRRQALNMTLIQQAIVDGRVNLSGLEDDPTLFARPEGKSFLAIFPAIAASVNQLDEKIAHAKLTLISEHVGQQAGGIKGYHDNYLKAIKELTKKWTDYNKVGSASIDVEAEITKQHNRAWDKYLLDLGKRGWTPSTVPPAYHDQVRKNVRRSGSPVSSYWELNDEAGFREAIAGQVRKKTQTQKPDVRVRGERIPYGLSHSAFIGHRAVQAELRDKLQLPSNVTVPANASKEQFRQLFNAMRLSKAREEVKKYDAPLATFADGGSNYEQGLDAARAALVPPIALFFSLIGAMGHMGKLVYLLAKLCLTALQRMTGKRLLPHQLLVLLPFCVIAGVWSTLSNMDNRVTTSELYETLTTDTLLRVRGDTQTLQPLSLLAPALVNALHVVAVGQSYAYPYNEHLRVHYLQGITFGYHPQEK